MKPSPKSPSLDQFLNEVFNIDRKTFITDDVCVSCKTPAFYFRDDLSKKEFSISGLCQICQDDVFGTEEPI